MGMRGLLVTALVCGSAVGQGTASGKRPMTFDDLMAMKRVSDPQISPGGKWVMFSVTDVSLAANAKVNHLWVVGIDGKTPERQVTFGDGEASGRFAPDGKTIALTMKDQIFEMPWDEAAGTVGKAIQVTNVDGGADGAIWSPDSKRLLFVVSVFPECSDLGDWAKEDACDKAKQEAADKNPVKAQLFTHLLYRHWNAFTGERRSHIAVVNAADGMGLRDLTPKSAVGDAETPTFSLGGPLGYAWAPDSKEIAYVANLDPVPAASTNNDIFTLRLDEARAKAVKISTSSGSDDAPQYSPDGYFLAFRSQARGGYESDKFRLMRYNFAGKTTEDLLPTFDGWVDEFTYDKNGSEILFVSGTQGKAPIYTVGLGREGHLAVSKLADSGEFSDLAVTDVFDTVVAINMRADMPAALAKITRRPLNKEERVKQHGVGLTTEISYLSHLNDMVLAPLKLSSLESFTFAGAKDAKVQGFIVKPPNFDPKKKYPVKFLIHGGPQGAWGMLGATAGIRS